MERLWDKVRRDLLAAWGYSKEAWLLLRRHPSLLLIPLAVVLFNALENGAGNYVARSFNLNSNSTLTVSGGIVQIWVTGSLSIGGNANNGGVPENLEFLVSSVSGANVNGGAAVSALIYAPTGPVTVGAVVHGSVTGSRTTLNSGGQVVFDATSICPAP